MLRMVLFLALVVPAQAESLVATRTIRAKSVITAEDITSVDAEIAGALADPAGAVGMEARVAIYAGKPVRLADLGPPALVDRNQVVTLVYLSGGLSISTEGRALARGAEGDEIQVLNLGSRNTVTGRIGPDGTVYVGWNG